MIILSWKLLGKKSQIVITDAIVGLMIFLVLILLVFFLWDLHKQRLDDREQFEDMRTKAFQISNIFVRTQGDPTDWENDSSKVQIIGFAQSDRILSKAKVDNFTALDSLQVIDVLAMGQYNFTFNLSYIDGSPIASFGGKEEADNVVEIRRYVIYENEKSVMSVRIWK